MKIYLAARYSRIDEINEYANQLRKAGHDVDARWLLGNHQIHEGVDKVEGATVSVPMEGQTFALDDVADLQDAEVVISFTETPRSGHSRGGRHVEFGMALAWGKRLIVIGPRENVFHTMPGVLHFWEWGPDVVSALSELEDVSGAWA